MLEFEELSQCKLCPRECGVDRLQGKKGYCKVDGQLIVARAGLHYWEEPCISAQSGSGTVFFSGCNMGCVFCQNQKIASGKAGKYITTQRLTEIFLELQEKGAVNINLVTPTHYIYQIKIALKNAKAKGLHIPIVYNTSGYEKVESLKLLEGLIDIYLPDFKYYSSLVGKKYAKVNDYFEKASLALEEMVKQVGSPVFSEAGIMQKGVIVRHLMLPGYLQDSKNIISYLYETYGNRIYISIMNQYTPLQEQIKGFPELNRKVSKISYKKLINYASELGVENGFIQQGETALESFIPNFNNEGV
ncbi:radical SAM protein [Cellulosilyticum ruminicola]|uniref:radical SAM protein n=1 Tax=Cellulosilyticum ruminicola TaxID=425254 RepID=UPI000B08C6F4|nr:radical SAM protein [Cellulosilyticum ruminicola]